MIVCLCHGVKESEVEHCVAQGAESLDEIGEACGAGTSCGCCRQVLSRKLIEAENEQQQGGLGLLEPSFLGG